MSGDPDEVEIIPGVVGPRRTVVDVTALYSSGNVEQHFVFVFDEGARRYVCDEVSVKRSAGGAVTTEALRDLAVAGTMRAALLVQWPDKPHIRDVPNPASVEPWGRQLPTGLTDEGPTSRVLAWVAHFYRLGVALDEPPTRTVQEVLGLSRTTAIRWVMAARERGFLGEAEVGKAGEKRSAE